MKREIVVSFKKDEKEAIISTIEYAKTKGTFVGIYYIGRNNGFYNYEIIYDPYR